MRKLDPRHMNLRLTPFTHWLRTAEVGDDYLLPLSVQRTNVMVSAETAGVKVEMAQAVVVAGTRTEPEAVPRYLVRIVQVL